MKRLLALSFMFLAYNAGAQSVNLGIGVGGAVNGNPNGNLVYVGDQTLLNYAGQMKFGYTTVTKWQYGLVGHIHELSSKSSKSYPGFPNDHLRIDSVGGDGKKLVYAKVTVAACAYFNRQFNLDAQGNTSIYLGVAAGWGFARNNSKVYKENESYKGADGGDGLCLGGQIGLNSKINDVVAFFLDVAPRYYDFEFDAGAPTIFPPENMAYSIFAVPITVGLNFNLYTVPESTRGTFNVKKRKYN